MPKVGQRISMQQIAEKAGVSIMTVSRVLRNHPRHKKDTRERVLKIAKELGYTKHPLVSALMSEYRGRSSSVFSAVIAYIHCLPYHCKPLLGHVATMQSVKRHCRQQGYEMEEFHLNEPDMTPKRLISILKNRGIRGCILEPFYRVENVVDLDLSQFASVAIGHSLAKPNLHRVEKDEYTGTLTAFEKLRKYGYKRIGLAVHSINESIHQFKRIAGFAIAQLNIPKEECIPPLPYYKLKTLHAELKPWLDEHKPDAVISNAQETMQTMIGYGYRIPGDVGFAQLDLLPDEEGVAGIYPHWEQIGEVAANQVIDQMTRNEFGLSENPIVTTINGKWIDGDTVFDHKSEIGQRALAEVV